MPPPTRSASSWAAATRGSSSEDDYEVVATGRSGPSSGVTAAAAPTSSSPSGAEQGPSKKPKLAPLFQKQTKAPASPVSWTILDEKGKGSCLQGIFQDPFSAAVKRAREAKESKGSVTFACFDLDGTLVSPKGGRSWPSPTDEYDFQQVFRDVFAKVKEEHEKGSVIVIVSNQKQRDPVDLHGAKIPKLETWKRKLVLICKAIGCPAAIYAACGSDKFRKPATGMWDAVLGAWDRAGGRVDDVALGENVAKGARGSFYVGDAAGRHGDHSDTDRKWALNLGMPFFTPQGYFQGREEDQSKWKLRGHRPALGDGEQGEGETVGGGQVEYEPTEPPLVAAAPEVILFVGPPAAGKTSFYRRHFQPAGYAWVNQDTLKTRPKCLAAVAAALEQGKSVVVDNTNRDEGTRKGYIDLAKAKGWGVRAVWFDLPEDVLEHNNHYRAKGGAPHEPPRELIPTLAFQSYYKALQPPTTVEGIDEVKVVKRVLFQGDEEARRSYGKWWA